MTTVNTFSWNPRRPFQIPLQYTRPLGRVDNFGDMLGPLIVDQLAPTGQVRKVHRRQEAKLLTVGSVMHFAQDGDTVWGTGVNGKVPKVDHRFTELDVRAVRGPLTKAYLEELGIEVPAIFGDPALLVPYVFPELVKRAEKKLYDLTIVPNLNDWPLYAHTRDVLKPTADVWTCLNRIANSSMIVGSSLHAIVIAESLGIPARIVKPGQELSFKYADYYAGTGRTDVEFASSVAEAVYMGGVAPGEFDAIALLDAFPLDLWAEEAAPLTA